MLSEVFDVSIVNVDKSRLAKTSFANQSMFEGTNMPPSVAAGAAVVPVSPGAAAGEWLLSSVYRQQLRELAAYRRNISALWATAIQQQQHAGQCWFDDKPRDLSSTAQLHTSQLAGWLVRVSRHFKHANSNCYHAWYSLKIIKEAMACTKEISSLWNWMRSLQLEIENFGEWHQITRQNSMQNDRRT